MDVNQEQYTSDDDGTSLLISSLLCRFKESYQFVNGDDVDHGPWRVGQRVWVCKSQGRRKSTAAAADADAVLSCPRPPRTPELFLRASILFLNESDNKNCDDDDDNRIVVQYPGGSTYRVRRDLLVPVLETAGCSALDGPHATTTTDKTNMVVVYPETNDYRRACVTHTGPAEDFWEIGCAQGMTCHRVQQTGDDAGSVAAAACSAAVTDSAAACAEEPSQRRQRFVVGLDKSTSTIATARQQYPACHFFVADILDDHFQEDHDDAMFITAHSPPPPPRVVGIDIGGNRDLEPVLQCLQVVLEQWNPRLVLVKSRALHCGLSRQKVGMLHYSS